MLRSGHAFMHMQRRASGELVRCGSEKQVDFPSEISYARARGPRGW